VIRRNVQGDIWRDQNDMTKKRDFQYSKGLMSSVGLTTELKSVKGNNESRCCD